MDRGHKLDCFSLKVINLVVNGNLVFPVCPKNGNVVQGKRVQILRGTGGGDRCFQQKTCINRPTETRQDWTEFRVRPTVDQ